MRTAMFGVGAALLAAACSGDLTSGSPDPVPGHNVTITAQLGGHSADGDTVTLHIANSGTDAAFTPRCGTQPLMLTQQFVNGVWIGGVQNFMCIASVDGPVTIAPGTSIDILRVLQPGRYRMIVSVAGKSDLSDASQALSDAFDTP